MRDSSLGLTLAIASLDLSLEGTPPDCTIRGKRTRRIKISILEIYFVIKLMNDVFVKIQINSPGLDLLLTNPFRDGLFRT